MPIRNQLEYEVMQRRVRYLEAQLAVLIHDVAPSPETNETRTRLRAEIDAAKRELAGFVAGVPDWRD